MTEKTKEQVLAQLRVVAHLARQIAIAHEQTAEIYQLSNMGIGLIDVVGQRTAFAMEALGNLLNDMDAVDEAEDAWVDTVFKAAQELWPNS